MPENRLLTDLTAAVREAGDYALSRFGGAFRHWHKSGHELVSEVDLSVDKRLRAALSDLAPDAGWLSEETADSPERLGRKRLWVVDPIDGTRDFIRGRPGWCVSVALVEQGQPVLGVLHAPARDELWSAARGMGATCNGAAIAASTREQLAGARVPADVLPRVDRDLVAVAKPNSIALRAALVAADRADLLATVRWGHEWDLAAAALIAAEAGAAVSDARGRPLAFNTPAAQILGIVVTAPALHGPVLERIAPAVAKSGQPERRT